MSKSNQRMAYGKALVELGKRDPNVVVLDADLSKSSQGCLFEAAFPERYFDLGIKEQDMMSTAAGLACSGKIAFANSFAVFAAGRAFDQIRQTISIGKLNVKVCGSDVHGWLGVTGRRTPPMVMGHEFSGIISALGEGVTGWSVGAPVTVQPMFSCGHCDYCKDGLTNLCNDRELKIFGTYIYTDADFRECVRLLSEKPQDFTGIISEVIPVEQAQESFEELSHGATAKIKVLVDMRL